MQLNQNKISHTVTFNIAFTSTNRIYFVHHHSTTTIECIRAWARKHLAYTTIFVRMAQISSSINVQIYICKEKNNLCND